MLNPALGDSWVFLTVPSKALGNKIKVDRYLSLGLDGVVGIEGEARNVDRMEAANDAAAARDWLHDRRVTPTRGHGQCREAKVRERAAVERQTLAAHRHLDVALED